MNLTGIICYLQKSTFEKTGKKNIKVLGFLYFPIDIRLKELCNSNDFSGLAVTYQSLFRIYNLKDNFSTDKKLMLSTKEICVTIEEDLLKKTFFKGIKNFSYWHHYQWIVEKEFYLYFFLIPTFTSVFFSVNPSNYYVDSWFGSLLTKEKTKTWVILLLIDIFNALDILKELYWNLKFIFYSTVKNTNKDIFFNFTAINDLCSFCTWKKFFNDILMHTSLKKGRLISFILIVMEIKKTIKN